MQKHKITEGVYVVGSEDLEVDDSKIIAKYWKNCSAVILYDGVHSAFTTDIKVIGNDVYVNLTNLTKGEQFKPATANDIFVVKKIIISINQFKYYGNHYHLCSCVVTSNHIITDRKQSPQ